jgi:hypothetical protein
MARRKFFVIMEVEAVIELDDNVIDVVDDEWRSHFYPLHSAEDIAGHIVYNRIANHAQLSQLDGWADQPNSNAILLGRPEWTTEEIIEQKEDKK